MMAIVSSDFIEIPVSDAAKRVIEKHTDQTGRVWERKYKAPLSYDVAANLSTGASIVQDQLAYAEAQAVLNG